VASVLYIQYVELTSPVLRRAQVELAESYRSPALFQSFALQLGAFKQLTDASGAALIALTFPDTGSRWEQYPYREVHRQLDDLWKRLGATHVDLLPVFERHRPDTLHVGLLDAHPNELAHRLAAREVADAVARRLGRPRRPPASPDRR
jgi:hypothetical protein